MSNLIIKNRIISSDILTILNKIRSESANYYFDKISNKGEYVMCTCPFHADGKESHPSFSVYAGTTNDDVQFGTYHCFTCGESGKLDSLVAYCLDYTIEEAQDWLVDNFGDIFIEAELFDTQIELPGQVKQQTYLDESILDTYAYFHPYMFQRKLTEDVIRKFKIGYNKEHETITFPVWDINNHLVTITERSVNSKFFHLEANKEKPVYLLNFIKAENIKTVYVCESQINALTLWSWGYPAVALFGTGTKEQYDILKSSGVRNFILCLDGDDAGRKGTSRFITALGKNCFITVKQIPEGKDVNDLTKEEFDNLSVI